MDDDADALRRDAQSTQHLPKHSEPLEPQGDARLLSVSLQNAQRRRALLEQTHALPTQRSPLRKTRRRLSRHVPACVSAHPHARLMSLAPRVDWKYCSAYILTLECMRVFCVRKECAQVRYSLTCSRLLVASACDGDANEEEVCHESKENRLDFGCVGCNWGGALAQSGLQYDALEYLQANFNRYMVSGFSTSHGPFYGTLDQGSSQVFELQLIGGYRYRFLAACTQNCSDVDIKIYENGKLIASDTLVDDFPYVDVNTNTDRRLTIQVGMASCRGTCGWALVGGSNYGRLIS